MTTDLLFKAMQIAQPKSSGPDLIMVHPEDFDAMTVAKKRAVRIEQLLKDDFRKAVWMAKHTKRFPWIPTVKREQGWVRYCIRRTHKELPFAKRGA